MKFPSAGIGGYPVHEFWSERDRKGNEIVHDCGGLLMVPEDAGLRTPIPPHGPGKRAVVCTICSVRTGHVMYVDDAKYERVVAASACRPGDLGPFTLTLGHLSKAARRVLDDAFWGRIEAAKAAPAKPFMELYNYGLIHQSGELTDAGEALGNSAGWGKSSAEVA
jgi:hypothetical protein